MTRSEKFENIRKIQKIPEKSENPSFQNIFILIFRRKNMLHLTKHLFQRPLRGLRDTGFTKEILRKGGGICPRPGSLVTVHYTGKLEDGTVFDKSQSPFKFMIGHGQVIKGWDQGVMTMNIGEKAELICAPEFAYGKNGYPPVIPRNATLVFEVELLDVRGY